VARIAGVGSRLKNIINIMGLFNKNNAMGVCLVTHRHDCMIFSRRVFKLLTAKSRDFASGKCLVSDQSFPHDESI
jgi:hypothetical protein